MKIVNFDIVNITTVKGSSNPYWRGKAIKGGIGAKRYIQYCLPYTNTIERVLLFSGLTYKKVNQTYNTINSNVHYIHYRIRCYNIKEINRMVDVIQLGYDITNVIYDKEIMERFFNMLSIDENKKVK